MNFDGRFDAALFVTEECVMQVLIKLGNICLNLIFDQVPDQLP
jgi:hypothetical protein